MEQEVISKADISDVLIERPVSFSIKGRHFLIYRPTLGKIQLLSRLFEAIGYNKLQATDDIYYHTFIVARDKVESCIRIIAYSTLPSDECLDEGKVKERIKELKDLDTEDIATILIMIFRLDRTDDIMRQFGMDKEAKRLNDILKVKAKTSGNSPSFGGKSLWGSLIDVACERYGWSLHYVLWGISYSNLRLLLADQVRTVFLTDEERKQVHIPSDNTTYKVDGGQSFKDFVNTQNWR